VTSPNDFPTDDIVITHRARRA